jgi:hypothetical protein
MPEPAPPPESDPAEQAAVPEAEADEIDDEYEEAPEPMPGEGNLAVAAMWLFATALCAGFLVAAAILVFDLAAGSTPAGEIARSTGYCVAFGTFTALYVVLALQLRWRRAWARRGAVALECAAIAFCVYAAGDSLLPVPDVPVLSAGHALLGIVVHTVVILLVCTDAMRDWCAGAAERPSPAGLGRTD